MADFPKELLGEIKRLEELFTVSPAKLKTITRRFVSELGKGIAPSLTFQNYALRFVQVLALKVGAL